MNTADILLIGAGLAMDAFAVAICRGLQMKKGIIVKHLLIIAAFFGGFQALMPCIGYFLGKQFEQYIVSFDHWIAFALLAFLGGKMIFDAVKEGGTAPVPSAQILYNQAIIDGIAKSAAKGREVEIEIPEI